MRTKTVDALPPLPRRGRVSQYQPVYDQLRALGPDQWLEVTCDNPAEFKKVLTSLRTHTTPRLRTRTTGMVIYAQPRD